MPKSSDNFSTLTNTAYGITRRGPENTGRYNSQLGTGEERIYEVIPPSSQQSLPTLTSGVEKTAVNVPTSTNPAYGITRKKAKRAERSSDPHRTREDIPCPPPPFQVSPSRLPPSSQPEEEVYEVIPAGNN